MDLSLAPVAVDAMGGDFAPEAVVHGGYNAARKGLPMMMVGDEARVRAELGRHAGWERLPITLRHTSQVVEMAEGIFVLGRLLAVERPAICSVLPAVKGRPLLLDMGANVDCKPIHLVQFAL